MNEVTAKKQEILCIVTQTPQRELSEEAEAIRNGMENDSRFEVKIEYVRSSKQIGELIQAQTSSTQIVHFLAEGEVDGTIMVPDPDKDNKDPNKNDNKADNLKPDVLAGFFESANNINCVVLNFCYSKPVAELIEKSKRIPCVIGIDGRIELESAASFFSGFYKALKGKVLTYEVFQQAFSKGEALAKDRIKEGGEYYIFQQKPEMQIEIPEHGSIVPYPCECSGTFKNLYKGASMWAYINATIEGKFYVVPINNYPKRSLDGEWRVPLKIGPPEGDSGDYKIGVFMVNPETTPGLKSNYDKAVKEHGYYVLDELPNEGIEVVGEEREVRRQ